MTLDELVQASVSQEKERRRYALLQAAAIIYARQDLEFMDRAVDEAEGLLLKIEQREKESK